MSDRYLIERVWTEEELKELERAGEKYGGKDLKDWIGGNHERKRI